MAAVLLMDEIVEEVLFCIPPDDPMTLVRASLVCKQWRCLVSDPGFRRRYRDFHGAPPMLGVLCQGNGFFYQARFFPNPTFRSDHMIATNLQVVDARHGRVLLRGFKFTCSFAIWDLIKDEITCKLPNLPFTVEYANRGIAAVLCAAATGGGSCDHLCCKHGPFRVVYIGITNGEGLCVHIYSSEDGAWRKHSSSQRFHDAISRNINNILVPSELLRNALHFVLGNSDTKILKYDLTTRDASVISTPTNSHGYGSCGVLMTTEEGELGFACVEFCRVRLWSRQQATLEEADVGWALTSVIELQLPKVSPYFSNRADLVGFANGVTILFLRTASGIYAVDLKSGKMTTISMCSEFYCVYPYMNFYPL